jgi:hypothetical protein
MGLQESLHRSCHSQSNQVGFMGGEFGAVYWTFKLSPTVKKRSMGWVTDCMKTNDSER